MPVPRPFRRVARFLNPAVLPLARRFPPLAVVHHVGRTSGRRFENPVMAFSTAGGWVVSLAYGSDVQWARNLKHSQGGALTRAGLTHRVGEARPISRDRAAEALPGWARRVMRSARVDEFLLLTRDAAAPGWSIEPAGAGDEGRIAEIWREGVGRRALRQRA